MAISTYTTSANDSGIVRLGVYSSGVGEAGSEVVAFENGKLYVTNGALGRIDVIDAATMTLVTSVDLTGVPNYKGLNSVAVRNGVIAVAIDTVDEVVGADTLPRNGYVALLSTSDLAAAPVLLETGNHPDMVTFSADGSKIFVANEAEYDEGYGANQPVGGITVVDLTLTISTTGTAARAGSTTTVVTLPPAPVASTYDLSVFDGQEDALRALGVRIFPGQSAGADFEPEYIAVSPDGTTLFVTLQEANAVATFDLATRTWTGITTQGVTDHSLVGNELDASDRDGAISITTHPVFGLRMADAIASFEVDGVTYYITANEGDDRGESARLKDLDLDPTLFPNAAALQADANIGRLNVSTIDGDTDNDGDLDAIYAYGGRSFSIYKADGTLVHDSGSGFETLIAQLRTRTAFNADGSTFDGRSDNKGPEPEAVAVGEVDGTLYAFVGAERDGGIFVYNIEDPAAPVFAAYIESALLGDVSPEVIRFISAADSGTGAAQLAVAYEISGTTALIGLSGRIDAAVAGRNDDATGSLGDDVLRGRAGSNELAGGGGDDVLRGGFGDDILRGGVGDDRLVGGLGADTYVFELGDGQDRIWQMAAGDLIDLTASDIAEDLVTISAVSATQTRITYGALGDSILVGHAAGVEIGFDVIVTVEDILT